MFLNKKKYTLTFTLHLSAIWEKTALKLSHAGSSCLRTFLATYVFGLGDGPRGPRCHVCDKSLLVKIKIIKKEHSNVCLRSSCARFPVGLITKHYVLYCGFARINLSKKSICQSGTYQINLNPSRIERLLLGTYLDFLFARASARINEMFRGAILANYAYVDGNIEAKKQFSTSLLRWI